MLSQQPALPRALAAALGVLEPNPSYVAPIPPVVRRPWTEEHQWVIWTVLGVVGAALVVLIVATARQVKPEP